MARKLRRKDSGFLVLLLLAVSFAISYWAGINFYTVIIAIGSVAILVMLGGIARKQGRRIGIRRSRGVAKKKTSLTSKQKAVTKREISLTSKQKRGIALGLTGVGILALLVFIATPIINWFSQNLRTIITVVLLLVAFAVAASLIWTDRWRIITWIFSKPSGTYLKEYTWFPPSVKDKQILLIRDWIFSFNPKKDYDLEAPYHDELFNWLKYKDPQAIRNPRRGSTMPDIAIGKVAIEVKGPTENRDLDTIPTKSWRYLDEAGHYSFLFIVLFKPMFTEDHFFGIRRQLKRQFPSKAAVITKKRNRF